MARTAAWRDVSKTTASGVFIPEYRLHLPSGDVIVKLIDGAAFNPKDKAGHIYCAKCFSLGIHETPLGERDPERAKKVAIELVKKKIIELMESCHQDLEALKHIIDYNKTLQKQQVATSAKPLKKPKDSHEENPSTEKQKRNAPMTKLGAGPLSGTPSNQTTKKCGRKKL